MEKSLAVQKRDILTQLYSLRTGLSSISINVDRIRAIQEKRNEELNKIIDGVGCGITSNDLKDRIDYINSGEIEIDLKNGMAQLKRQKKKNRIHMVLAIIFCIFSVCLAVIFCGKFALNCRTIILLSNASAEPIVASQFWILPVTLIGFGLIILSITSISSIKKEGREISKTLLYETNLLIDLPNIRQAITKQYKSNIAINNLQAQCLELYNFLKQQFYILIDLRDWKHLDLVIFYFESGRADSIKEALQLVDREIQTERIIKSIEQATAQICKAIENATEKICKTVTKCFNDLYDQLDRQHSEQMAQLRLLTNAVNVGNALQTKADVSSQQLVADMDYIIRFKL